MIGEMRKPGEIVRYGKGQYDVGRVLALTEDQSFAMIICFNGSSLAAPMRMLEDSTQVDRFRYIRQLIAEGRM